MATEASKESVSKENNHENDFDKKDDNPFIELVNKKIRKANKKMQRIVALKAQIKEKHASINEDQKILLASEEGTTTLLKELEDLRSQMLKLAKESPQPAEAPKKKEKEKKKKETKKEKVRAISSDFYTTLKKIRALFIEYFYRFLSCLLNVDVDIDISTPFSITTESEIVLVIKRHWMNFRSHPQDFTGSPIQSY